MRYEISSVDEGEMRKTGPKAIDESRAKRDHLNHISVHLMSRESINQPLTRFVKASFRTSDFPLKVILQNTIHLSERVWLTGRRHSSRLRRD